MDVSTPSVSFEEKRKEARIAADQFYSVEIFVPQLTRRYQFKLRDISNDGMSILVKDDSLILNHLAIGDTLEMLYHPPRGAALPEALKTKIKHVSKNESGRYRGHTIVGLHILEKNAELPG